MRNRNRQLNRKQVNVKADEYFVAGPLEFARFGKFAMTQSRMTDEELNEIRYNNAKRLPDVESGINEIVARIANRVASLPPERLLQRSWWEFVAIMLLPGDQTSDLDQTIAMRMIDYIQSVIASVQPVLPHPELISDEAWQDLSSDIRNLFTQLSTDYQFCRTAKLQCNEPKPNMAMEEFRYRAETQWMILRGKRYKSHEIQALNDLLSPHSEILLRLFNIDAPTLVNELEKILNKLTFGLNDLMINLKQLQEECFDRLCVIAADSGIEDIESLRETLFEDSLLSNLRDRVTGELFDLDFFDVEKITRIPKTLLDELAYAPGEELEFFAPGEFCGWPLKVWPTMKRPFIRLLGRTLCFDYFALFDNIYRVLQRVILRLEPGYKESWNKYQMAISEKLPFILLERILPCANIIRPVYYRHKQGKGPSQWNEADGILIYDDHLFVIEVKAGSFTHSSPATNLPSHIESLKNLVLNPVNQGNRFVDFLENNPEVSLCDAEHKEIQRIRRSEFRHVTLCAVTLDAFTEIAARANHLYSVGIDLGHRPVWSVSIDDLRVYADIFKNPLRFLHYVEQRTIAAQSTLVDLHDELDHVGLYIENNNYSQYSEEIVGESGAKLFLSGYRTLLDKYYEQLIAGEPATLPMQETPHRIDEIIEFLAKSNKKCRAKVTSLLLDYDGATRNLISNRIDQMLVENRTMRRIRPVSIYCSSPLTFTVCTPDAPRDAQLALKHTKVIALGKREPSRFLIELEYSITGKLVDVHWQTVAIEGLSVQERLILERDYQELRRRRMLTACANGRIGRNDPCPCASGKKFKKCCMR